MKQNVLETLTGFVVLIIAFSFFWYSYTTNNFSTSNSGYILHAGFQNIDGIAKGADVKIAGVKIGTVDSFTLEKDTYYALLNLKLNDDVEIPSDSTAIVSTSGLLGGKYIRINPGAADDNLKQGGKIKYTQSSLNIEDLIGKLMYSLTSK